MDKKDVIINGLVVVVVLLACIFVGYKMGNQQGMVSVCEDMGGKLGLDSRTDEIKCLNSSFFEPDISNPQFNTEVFFDES